MKRLLAAAVSGVACYFAATAGNSGLAIAFGLAAAALVMHVAHSDLALILNVVRVALCAAIAFTGIALAVSIHRDHVAGALLYGVLLAMCIGGLLLKPADKRPIA